MPTKFNSGNATLTLDCTPEPMRGASPEAAANQLHAAEASLKSIGAAARKLGINATCTGRNEFTVDGGGVPSIIGALNNTVPTGRFDSRTGAPIEKPDAAGLNTERTRVTLDATDLLNASGINAQSIAINGKPVNVRVNLPRR